MNLFRISLLSSLLRPVMPGRFKNIDSETIKELVSGIVFDFVLEEGTFLRGMASALVEFTVLVRCPRLLGIRHRPGPSDIITLVGKIGKNL